MIGITKINYQETECPCGGACNHRADSYDEARDLDQFDFLSSDVTESTSDESGNETDEPGLPSTEIIIESKHEVKNTVKGNIVQRKKQSKGIGEIQETLRHEKCCKDECLQQKLTLEDVWETRKQFWDLRREQQVQFLQNFFMVSQRKQNGKIVIEHAVRGKVVCQKAWKVTHDVSNGRYFFYKNEFEKKGWIQSVHGRQAMKIKSQRLLNAELWFEEIVSSLGNVMPDYDRKELPACYTVTKIHKMYVDDMADLKPLSLSQFRRMWKTTFREVTIPKTNRFSKCGVCLLINDHIRSQQTKEDKLLWKMEKELHMEQQGGERKKYLKHQKKAEKFPKKYMSVIIDGMDQSKTNLPHWIQTSKLEGDNAGFLKVHVTGILNHGLQMPMCFLNFLRWPQDANPTINCLISHFRHVLRTHGELPPVLYLQIDNCYRDCKNIYIMGFCALLVKAGVFKKVRLSYLMVGHTHEDIDQMFSRISVALRKNDAVTMEALKEVIHKSYTPSPVLIQTENMYDVKSWLRPYTGTLQHHSHPHAFRFKKNKDDHVEMNYRNWARSPRKQWLPKLPFKIMEELPAGKPALLRPELKKCPTVEKMSSSFDHLKVRMTPDQTEWWEKLIDEERTKVRQWESMSDRDREEIGQSFDLLEMHYTEPAKEKPAEKPEVQKRSQELRRIIDKTNHFPEVVMTKKPKYHAGGLELQNKGKKQNGSKIK